VERNLRIVAIASAIVTLLAIVVFFLVLDPASWNKKAILAEFVGAVFAVISAYSFGRLQGRPEA
jgi:uncharacterized membrane protein